MANGPFKMKGSPMARNFGTPFRNDKKKGTKYTGPTLPKEMTDVLSEHQEIKKEQDAKGKNRLYDGSYKASESVLETTRRLNKEGHFDKPRKGSF